MPVVPVVVVVDIVVPEGCEIEDPYQCESPRYALDKACNCKCPGDAVLNCPLVKGLEQDPATCECVCAKRFVASCAARQLDAKMNPVTGTCECECPQSECPDFPNMITNHDTCGCECDPTVECPGNQILAEIWSGRGCTCTCPPMECPANTVVQVDDEGRCSCQCRDDMICPQRQVVRKREDGSCGCECDPLLQQAGCAKGFRFDRAKCRCVCDAESMDCGENSEEPWRSAVLNPLSCQCECPACPYQNQEIYQPPPSCSCRCNLAKTCGRSNPSLYEALEGRNGGCECQCRHELEEQCLDRRHYVWKPFPHCQCVKKRSPTPDPHRVKRKGGGGGRGSCPASKVHCNSNSRGCVSKVYKSWWFCPNNVGSCNGVCVCSRPDGFPARECPWLFQQGTAQCYQLDGEPAQTGVLDRSRNRNSGGRQMSHLKGCTR